MDAFLTSLLAVLLTETGGSTQLLCAVAALRYSSDRRVMAGLAIATALNCTFSAVLGSAINGWISESALHLFYALACLFAGIGMLLKQGRVDDFKSWRIGALLSSSFAIGLSQLGDKSQFLIAATAARTDAVAFAAVGGWLGIMIACTPAIVFREQLAATLPLTAIRRVGGVAFLLVGLALALGAFGLFG